jgi:transcriptional regulator with XRE-family HTH domain
MNNVKAHRLTPETGAMLRAVRKQKHWTLEKASQEVGVHLSHIWRLEAGQAAPSTALATDIMFAYGLNRDQARILMSESVPGVGRSKPSGRKANTEVAA